MATAHEVEQWKDLCRKLNTMNDRLHMALDNAVTRRLKAEDERKAAKAVADGLEWQVQELRAENEKLLESVRNLLICRKHEECEEGCPYYEPMYTDYGYEKYGSIVVESEYLGCCAVGLENCNSSFFDTDEYLRELGIEVDK